MDPSYKPIEQAMIEAIRTITATRGDWRAWEQFSKDHPSLTSALRAATREY